MIGLSKARQLKKRLNGGDDKAMMDGDGGDKAERKNSREWSAGEGSRDGDANKDGYEKDGSYIPHENKVDNGAGRQDIFQVHKDLLHLIKNRPDNPNQVVPEQLNKQVGFMDNTVDGGKTIMELPQPEAKTQTDEEKEKPNLQPAKVLVDHGVQAEWEVDYLDKKYGLQKKPDDDLHNQILNELVLANDMAHQSRINQDAIDARMREMMRQNQQRQKDLQAAAQDMLNQGYHGQPYRDPDESLMD